jgi:type IV pilus assembly protein PilE
MEIRMRSRKTLRSKATGVTLVELLIAVAIVGILAAIAYPSYQAQVRRGNRTDAKAELMEAAQELEKCYTRYGAYNNVACNSYNVTLAGNRLSEKGKYRITFAAGSVTANTYILRAALEQGRGQDPECGVLTLDQSGLRGRSGDAPIDRCW